MEKTEGMWGILSPAEVSYGWGMKCVSDGFIEAGQTAEASASANRIRVPWRTISVHGFRSSKSTYYQKIFSKN